MPEATHTAAGAFTKPFCRECNNVAMDGELSTTRMPSCIPSYRHVAAALFAGMFVLILFIFPDYGMTWDEHLHAQYGQAIVDYYASHFKDQRHVQLFDLYLYGGMFDFMSATINYFFPSLDIYKLRHLLNALIGLLGLFGTWRLGRILGGNSVGLVALILCATAPMYFGHMFNNSKDIPFAAGIVWSCYFMARSYAKPAWPTIIKLGIVMGLTLGIRVGGIIIFFFWLVPMGFEALRPWLTCRNRETALAALSTVKRQALRVVLPVVIISYLVMLICWPWAQENPLINPVKAFIEFSNFKQKIPVMMHGLIYDSTNLPWYYVPLHFSVKLPLLLLTTLVLSIFFMPKIWSRFIPTQKQAFSLIVLSTVFPLAYAMLRRPTLYDGVRHFLFLVPFFCVLAALTIRTCLVWCRAKIRQPSAQWAIKPALLAIGLPVLTLQLYYMVKLHPYEYIYTNLFFGGVKGTHGLYSSDYWGESFKEAIKEFLAYIDKEGGVPPGKIYRVAVCGPRVAAMIYLPPNFQPVGASAPANFYLSTTRWMCHNLRPGREIVSIRRMGVPLTVIKDLRGGYEDYWAVKKN